MRTLLAHIGLGTFAIVAVTVARYFLTGESTPWSPLELMGVYGLAIGLAGCAPPPLPR